MLQLDRVKKVYGAHTIINTDTLNLATSVYWLKGPNGAGKSTILKMIAGMIPFDGTIRIDGTDLKMQPIEYRQLVNYIEAEPLYPPFLTGRDLLFFYQKARAADSGQVDLLRRRLGIDSFETKPVGTYSSGMVKRLSLALAFIGKPRLILLDEPLVTIDKDTVPLLFELVSEGAKSGTGFIIASHQPLDASLLPAVFDLEIRAQKIVKV